MQALPGFIYLLALLIWFQFITKEYISFYTIQYNLKEYSFYAGLVIMAFSYAIGIIVHFAEQFILHFIKPSFKVNMELYQFLSEDEQVARSNFYLILITIRHLIVSITLLDLGLIFLLSQKVTCFFLLCINSFYLIALIVSILAYLHTRSIIIGFNDSAKKVKEKKAKENLP